VNDPIVAGIEIVLVQSMYGAIEKAIVITIQYCAFSWVMQ